MSEPALVRSRALGTSMVVATSHPSAAAAAATAARRVVDAVDVACSRFRADSEIAAVHRRRGRETLVSSLLATALRAALRAARLSDGLVDPTVGAAVRAAGYDTDFASVPPLAGPVALVAQRAPGWERIHLDDGRHLVFVPADVEVDLGATAKALAADLAADAAARETGCGVLVSLGGDMAVAGPTPDEGWSVQLAEDSEAPPDPAAEAVIIRSGGLATSSTTVRRWARGSLSLHHIIDPRTGLPADGPWRTVSVAAGSCVDANTASTAAIVRGASAPEWLGNHKLPARLVDLTGRVVRCAGWPAGEARSPALSA
jgi:thiamine biosynthesis lipoprotein